MKASFAALVAAALLGGTTCVLAASNVDLTVKGIITPSACTPTLSQGGLIDHGKVSAKELSENTYTNLPDAKLQLGVNCESPVLYVVRGIDNREGTSWGGPWGFGLGLINDGTQKLGYYLFFFGNAVGDGERVSALYSPDGIRWLDNEDPYMWSREGFAGFGHQTAGIWAPIPIKQLTTDIRVNTAIAPTNGLTLTSEQPIDGSSTLEIVYR